MRISIKTLVGLLCGIVLLGILAGCGGGGGGAPVSLVAIQVTPANPSIALGTNQQFTATGVYSDGTSKDLTTQATWDTSNHSFATISNTAGSNGMASSVAAGPVTVSAKMGSITGSTNLTVKAAAVTLVSIGVTPANPSIAAGTQQQFAATGVFSDNSVQDVTSQVTWSSSNTGFATISATGLASAVAAGSPTITASLTISGTTVSGTATLNVTAATLSSVQVTPANPSVAKGTAQQFKATGVFSDNSKQDLTASVTWSSSNTAVATIAAGGLATGAGTGTATVTATLGGKSGSTTLTVTGAALTAIEVSPHTPSIALGTGQQFTAVGKFSDNTIKDITTAVTWISSAAGTATVSNAAGSKGFASSVAKGSTSITATLAGVSGSTLLTVTDATLVSIDVEPAQPTLPAGVTQQFTATGTFSDNTTADLTTSVTWSSSNPAAATISNAAGSNGLLVAGLANTSATISATLVVGGTTTVGSTVLSVTAATLQQIQVTPPNPTIPAGLQQQFAATGIYSDNSVVDLTSAVTWSSSSPAFAVISNDAASGGVATALSAGTTTISATFGAISSDASSSSATLTVTSATLRSIAVTPANPSIAVGTTQQFVATGTYSDNSTFDITQVVAWTSLTPAVAVISNVAGQKGVATAFSVGTTTITAALGNVASTGDTLTVTNATLQTITVTPANSTIASKTNQQFVATGNFNNNTTQDLTRQVTWSSANTAVATISNAASTKGVATGANVTTSSSTTITATLTIAGTTVSGNTGLTVAPATLTGIVVTPATPTVAVGATQQFTATGIYNNGLFTQDLTKAVKWTSLNKSVAITSNGFNSRGLANAVGAGTATIQATKPSTVITGSTTMTVQ